MASMKQSHGNPIEAKCTKCYVEKYIYQTYLKKERKKKVYLWSNKTHTDTNKTIHIK